MDKYSAEHIESLVREKNATYLPHHTCSICGEWVAYEFVNGQPVFNSRCGCPTMFPTSLHPRTFEDIADWLAMQKDDEARDKILAELK